MEQNIITSITVVEHVTLISLIDVPDDVEKIAAILSTIAKNNINIDMICQSVAYGGKVGLSFTLDESALPGILTVVSELKQSIPSMKTDVNPGNSKIIFFGESMRDYPGVAAGVFQRLHTLGIKSKLITSSEVDISVLVDENEPNLYRLEQK